VACTSASACVAVGGGVNDRANRIAIAATWNGIAWSAQHAAQPRGSSGAALTAVSCINATACIAVGYQLNGADVALPLVERWNGSAWTVQPTPAGRGGSLAGVSCVSAGSCVAVGTTSDSTGATVALADVWNGLTWKIVATPSVPNAPYAELSAVSCSAATACTAVGSATAPGFGTLAERWNGSVWSLETMALPSDGEEGFVMGVSCTSATLCVAAGDYINSSFTYVTLAERWDGAGWTMMPSPTPSGAYILQMTGLACSGTSACTAVGWTQLGAMVLRFNGSTWQLQPTPPPSGPPFVTAMLNGVSCAGVSACVSVGSFTGTLAEAWDGSAWPLMSAPNMPGVLNSALVAVSCITATSCTAVGNQEDAAGGQTSLAYSWNGTAWTVQPTPPVSGAVTIMLSGVSCTSPTACVAVGWYASSAGMQAPLAERWNGHAWSVDLPPVPSGAVAASLASVSCASATVCLSVGSSQTAKGRQEPLIERWDGSAWGVQSAPMPESALQGRLASISCISATGCVAVGEYLNGSAAVGGGHAHQPMADTWDGASWTSQSIARPEGAPASYLDAVSCTGPASCIAVGWFTGPAHAQTAMADSWNGSTWTMQPTADIAGATLAGVSCAASDDCTAVGAGGAATIAERWNGSAWNVQPTPNRPASARALQGVACPSSVTCAAVGTAEGTAGYQVTLAERYTA